MSILKYRNISLNLQEFMRFCIVGIICTGIDAGIFYTIRTIASYQIALISGYTLSLIANYFLSIHWTFKTQSSLKNMIGIVSAHLFNLFVVRMGLMWILVDHIGMSDKPAYIPTLAISVVSNFIIIRTIVHGKK